MLTQKSSYIVCQVLLRSRAMKPIVAFLALALFACGPTPRGHGDDDDGFGSNAGVDAPQQTTCTPSAEQCADAIDNDCDGLVDCNDPDCSGIGNCPVCGMVQHPLSNPLALPDGAGAGPPYTSKLHFDGFGPTQTFMAASNIISVCAKMEHSWVRDLQIELHSPLGFNNEPAKIVVLSPQLGNSCPLTGTCEVYLGEANDADDAENPVAGTGETYCWTPVATNASFIAYANSTAPLTSYNGVAELPPGDYQASDPWTNFIGSPLNGDWEISIQDKWGIDNGFIFEWSIAFDPSLVQDCSGPVIQ